MRIEIFCVPPKPGEWAQTSSQYSFSPQHGDHSPVVVVEVPNDWLLVGEPEPLLVRRTSLSDFTTRTATEVFYQAVGGGSGLRSSRRPGGFRRWDAISPLIRSIPSPETPALPAPNASGLVKAKPPARRSGQR